MSDRFRPLALEHLISWIADELEAKSSIFGIPCRIGFTPAVDDPFRTKVYGRVLETPLGVAAGPHSQLAPNIVVAWLCGARFIELKTVQTLDNLEISKPCIDMHDEGYNVEWSQELAIDESFREYLHAWIVIHALHRRLGFTGASPGIVFNLSVGYNLDGIRRPNMQRFLDLVSDAGEELDRCRRVVATRFPEVADIEIPARLSDNVTLSTMHGCPPDEIGAISTYLLRERRLHTTVKLNPTLLGSGRVRGILNDTLGFTEINVPDEAFAHDISIDDAVQLIGQLQATADQVGLRFGTKLTNTLEVRNHRPVFDTSERNMYLSGRPLHALTVTLAHELTQRLGRAPMLSFSGGADAFNTPALLRCGFRTITVCSDLLKPGGYVRLGHYLENLRSAMRIADSDTLEEFVRSGSPECSSAAEAAPINLAAYAAAVLSEPPYHASTFRRNNTKTSRGLGFFDCVLAPCTDACGVRQRVPEYMRRVRDGDVSGAASVTRCDNPLASILGRACHHPCEPVCLRTHMDHPLAIREIKRFITDHEGPAVDTAGAQLTGPPVAVIGAGPCGLAAATFLARAGRAVTVFEARSAGGGMVSATIPDYRATGIAIERDLERVRRLGVDFRYGVDVGSDLSLAALRREGFAAVVIAVGARRGRPLGLVHEDSAGVVDGLDFLRAARSGHPPTLGRRIGIIGGGDVAMDCARTALRLCSGEVTVFYRRTRSEMPAQAEEIGDLLDEGGRLVELTAPKALEISEGRLDRVIMWRMRPGEKDTSGRRRPEIVPGSEHPVELDTMIVAIGQIPDLGFLGDEDVVLDDSGFLQVDPETLETSLPDVYAGGDIIGDGPASIVKAAGDGRRIAEAILAATAGSTIPEVEAIPSWPAFDRTNLLVRRARTEQRVIVPQRPPSDRKGFEEVVQTLSREQAVREAARCVDCDVMCSTCEGVCPNRAIITYTATPGAVELPTFEVQDGRLVHTGGVSHRVAQAPQVAVLTDACNECGNCVTFCPTAGRPWRDKPRLYLHRGDFEAQDGNAFMLLQTGDRRGIQARFEGELHELIEGDVLRYVSPEMVLHLHPTTLEVVNFAVRVAGLPEQSLDTEQLGTMITLFRSLAASMPELPTVEAQPEWLIRPDVDPS